MGVLPGAGATADVHADELPLRPELASVSRARHWAAARCEQAAGDVGPDRLADVVRVVELVVSELVANAVEHGGPPVSIGVRRHGDVLRVRVADGNPTPPVPREQGAHATSGRGVALVAHLSSGWGVEPGTGGKVVWCDVALHPRAA
ncbi:ATP-binding protein [Kineococcus glutinatus]|uniref:Histidine kinase/HSP90-like ATPase domain-containing protein n=1 Tax=Kineococcus glutinatus TaxID=1070872 RepID=A0ABP9HCY5_9ACTN